MVEINWTLGLQIGNFLALIFILNSVVYKPIRGILAQRKAKMEGLTDSIDSTSKAADQKNSAFAEGIRQARAKGQKEKEQLVQAASEEERAIISRINAKAKEDLEAMKTKIANDTKAVKAALEKHVDDYAKAITQKILGRAA